MKYYFIVFIIFSSVFGCTAQTKKDTENWLTFYLNKFNSHSSRIIKGQGYIDSYGFYGDSLVVSQYNELGDSASWKIIYIDLKKVIKVEVGTDTSFSPSANLPCFRIWFYFDPPQYRQDKPPVTMMESMDGKQIRSSWSNPQELAFGDWEILDNNMPLRIKKAISHLVTLDGGKIIKEVF